MFSCSYYWNDVDIHVAFISIQDCYSNLKKSFESKIKTKSIEIYKNENIRISETILTFQFSFTIKKKDTKSSNQVWAGKKNKPKYLFQIQDNWLQRNYFNR